MADEETPSRYPYLISVRGGRPVPARRDGSYYVCAYQTFLGLWWPPREVRVLEYDPHRDFYREQRQAHLDAHPDAHPDPDRPDAAPPAGPTEPVAGPASATPVETTPSVEQPPVWERVASRPLPGPARSVAGPPASPHPGLGW